VGSVDIDDAWDVAISGHHAYVAAGTDGFWVVDIQRPPGLVPQGWLRLPGTVSAVAISGNYAYLGLLGGQPVPIGNKFVVDVSSPFSPRIVGGVGTGASTHGLAVDGCQVYIAEEDDLRIIPLQCPCQTPVLLFDFATTVQDDGILVTWRTRPEFAAFAVLRAEVTDGQPGPFERLASIERSEGGDRWEYLDRSAAMRTYAYRIEGRLWDGSEVAFGPVIASRAARTDFALRPVRPFPASESALVEFSVPRKEPLRLDVYDVAGRRVRALLADVRGPGVCQVVWDGRDDAGKLASNGIYLVRLSWLGGARTTRAAFVR
jgi:hypothetical protein